MNKIPPIIKVRKIRDDKYYFDFFVMGEMKIQTLIALLIITPFHVAIFSLYWIDKISRRQFNILFFLPFVYIAYRVVKLIHTYFYGYTTCTVPEEVQNGEWDYEDWCMKKFGFIPEVNK